MRRNMGTTSQWTPMCLANSLGADCKWSWSMSEGNFLLCHPNTLETCHESTDPTFAVHAGQLTDSKYHRHVASIVPAKLMWWNYHSASSWHACHQAVKPIRQEWKYWLSGTFSPILIHLAISLQLPMHTFPSAGTRSGIQSAFHQPLLGIRIDTVCPGLTKFITFLTTSMACFCMFNVSDFSSVNTGKRQWQHGVWFHPSVCLKRTQRWWLVPHPVATFHHASLAVNIKCMRKPYLLTDANPALCVM